MEKTKNKTQVVFAERDFKHDRMVLRIAEAEVDEKGTAHIQLDFKTIIPREAGHWLEYKPEFNDYWYECFRQKMMEKMKGGD